MHDVLAALMNRPDAGWSEVDIDLSRVRNVARPWTAAFAQIAYWGLKSGTHFRLTGLRRRVADMAALIGGALRESHVAWQARRARRAA